MLKTSFWQRDGEFRTFVHGTINGDFSPVQIDNTFGDGQSQAVTFDDIFCSGRISLIKTVKNIGEIVCFYPNALIFDRNFGVTLFLPGKSSPDHFHDCI